MYRLDVTANKTLDMVLSCYSNGIFRQSRAACPKCGRVLDVYYCEAQTYAVRCVGCEMVTLLKARNPEEAASKVGVVAIPLDDWSDDDGDVIAVRFPIRDSEDVCIGHPLTTPQTIPNDFTHFVHLPYPAYTMGQESNR